MLRAFVAFAACVGLVGPTDAEGAAAATPAGSTVRRSAVQPGNVTKPGFQLTDPRLTGVWFTNLLVGDAYATNAVAHNGSGVAIGDVNGDRLADLYFCGLQGPNRLYRNLGNWRFEELDPGPAACAEQYSTGTTLADVDGNGSLDLLVNGIGTGTRLFLNDGQGRFTERADSGLSRTASATSLALADIDGDGDLDLYCTHYIDVMHLADPTTRFALARRANGWTVTKVNDQPTTLPRWKDRFEALPDGSVRELPEYHGFYRNDGTGRFESILFEPGLFTDEHGAPLAPTRDWGLSVMFRDVNGDGAPDFYVCNDNASPDRFWINNGGGKFRDVARWKLRHTSRSSMGLDFADLNRDGHDDLFVLDMLARDHGKRVTQLMRDRPKAAEVERPDAQPRFNRNMLFLGQRDGAYAETALMAGVAATGWSWCPMFLDVDLDGYEDLLVTTGFGMDVMDQDSHDELRRRMRQMNFEERKRSRRLHPEWRTKSLAFRNRGDATFEPAASWGFDHVGIANGAALGDLDNDGDLDVVVNNLNEVATLYRNDSSAPRIGVRLKGLPPNPHGVGARITLEGGPVRQSQEVVCGGRYMSGDQATRVFAAAAQTGRPLRIEVRWRSGALTVVPEVEPNHIYEIQENPGAAPAPRPAPPAPASWFEDVSEAIDHRLAERAMEEPARQTLLPRPLTALGPGVAWQDLNEDGWEDLVVPDGVGGKLTGFINREGRSFRRLDGGMEATPDAPVVGWHDGRGNRFLLVPGSQPATPDTGKAVVSAIGANDLQIAQGWPAGPTSIGALAAADVDGDGDLDLFVGGRAVPGRYPEATASSVWLNEAGSFAPGAGKCWSLGVVGLVNGATFADFDLDGRVDLALATEWGPVRVLRNTGSAFEEVTKASGLEGFTGWWTGVAAGDFDGDGRLDLACGNWGRNSIYELYQPSPLRLYYGDWDGDDIFELIEAWSDRGTWYPVRDRAWLSRGLPDLASRFPTHQAFAAAAIGEILPPGRPNAPYVEAVRLDSTVFLNRGDHFEPLGLPAAAQRAPVFAVAVADFDGNGTEDLFLGQNFFGMTSDLSRDDGGCGVWMKGDGHGGFEAVEPDASGIRLLGEQRGGAVADYNHDGRPDLAVIERREATRLFLNRQGKPGLRVELRGPPANPEGVGALMRVVYGGGRRGPCRAVVAGSGGWSMNAPAQILGLQDEPSQLWVRWPDRSEEVVEVTPANRAIRVVHKTVTSAERGAGERGGRASWQVRKEPDTLHESPPERGLQSAGSHAGQGTSLRAEARAPHRFMATAQVRKEPAASQKR